MIFKEKQFEKVFVQIFLFLLLNVTFINCQIGSSPQNFNLEFNNKVVKKYILNEEKTFKLPTVQQQNIQVNQKLYIRAKLHNKTPSNKFLEPRISLMLPTGEALLICNQATNKFYQICAISLKSLFQIQSSPQQLNLQVKIMSLQPLVHIQLEAYISEQYHLQIGQQIFLEANQYKDTQIQKQSLIIKIPKNISNYQLIYFELYDQSPLSPNQNFLDNTKMQIQYQYSGLSKQKKENKSKDGNILKQYPQTGMTFRQCKTVSVSYKISCQMSTQQLLEEKSIKIEITYNDKFSKLRFYTYLSELQMNKQKKFIQSKTSEINNYYDFVLINQTVILKYDNFLINSNTTEIINDQADDQQQNWAQNYANQRDQQDSYFLNKQQPQQDLQLAIYLYSGQIESIKISTNNNFQNVYSIYEYTKNKSYFDDVAQKEEDEEKDQEAFDPNPNNLPFQPYNPKDFKKNDQTANGQQKNKNWQDWNPLNQQQKQQIRSQIQQHQNQIDNTYHKKPQNFYLFTIKKSLLKRIFFKNQINQISKQKYLYLQIQSLKEASFYVTLREKQIDNTIQIEWPQVIEYGQLQFSKNYIVEDWVQLNSKEMHHLQKYYVQIDNQLNYYNYLQRLYKNQNYTQNSIIEPQYNNINFMVSRCQSVEKNGQLYCIHDYANQFENKNKQQKVLLKVQHSIHLGYKQIISFEYDLTRCPLVNVQKNRFIHKCYFKFELELEIKLFNKKQQNELKYMSPFALILHKPTRNASSTSNSKKQQLNIGQKQKIQQKQQKQIVQELKSKFQAQIKAQNNKQQQKKQKQDVPLQPFSEKQSITYEKKRKTQQQTSQASIYARVSEYFQKYRILILVGLIIFIVLIFFLFKQKCCCFRKTQIKFAKFNQQKAQQLQNIDSQTAFPKSSNLLKMTESGLVKSGIQMDDTNGYNKKRKSSTKRQKTGSQKKVYNASMEEDIQL